MAFISARAPVLDQVRPVMMVMRTLNRTPPFLPGRREGRSVPERKISNKTSANSDPAEVVDPINPHSEKPLDLLEEPAL